MSANAVFDLVQKLADRGVELWPDGEGVRYHSRRGTPPAELLEQIETCRSELTASLARPRYTRRTAAVDAIRLPEHQLDWWNEVAVNLVVANGMHAALRIPGWRDPEALQRAMTDVFARHELLRCRLALREGAPCIMLGSSAPEVARVRATDAGESEADVVGRLIWQPFAEGAAFRSFLLERPNDVCIIGFVLHHFVADFCSCRVLVRELLGRIRQPAGAMAAEAARVPRYSDYLRGLNDWLDGPAPEYRLQYWRAAMRGAAAVRLPQDHDPGAAVTGPLASAKFAIARPLRARMAATAAGADVTILTVVLAAKFVALAHLLGRTDLVLTPVLSGRDEASLLNMVGNTVNCLPLRVSVTPDLTFSELLARVHAAHLLAYRHEIPWRLLLRRLVEVGASPVSPTVNLIPAGHFRPRDPAAPAVQGAETLSAVVPAKPAETGGIGWHSSHELHLFDSGQEIHGAVKYTSARYEADTMERFARTFVSCLERLTLSPGLRITEAIA